MNSFITFFEDEDFVTIHDSGDAVGNADDRAVGKFRAHGLLDEGVSLRVHGSRGFIQHQNPALLQERPAQTKELPLAHTPILAVLQHCRPTIKHM